MNKSDKKIAFELNLILFPLVFHLIAKPEHLLLLLNRGLSSRGLI
jgi:hypothetical protein